MCLDASFVVCSQVVNKEFMETGKWEIEIGAKRYPCVVSTRPMYDPNNAKIKL